MVPEFKSVDEGNAVVKGIKRNQMKDIVGK